MKTIRLFLVDDEQHVRRGLRMRLEMEPDFVIVGEAADACSAIRDVLATRPDIVLMDIAISGGDGISTAAQLGELAPECPVIIVSMQDDAGTRSRATKAGARAFVGKHEIDTALTNAIRSVSRGALKTAGIEISEADEIDEIDDETDTRDEIAHTGADDGGETR